MVTKLQEEADEVRLTSLLTAQLSDPERQALANLVASRDVSPLRLAQALLARELSQHAQARALEMTRPRRLGKDAVTAYGQALAAALAASPPEHRWAWWSASERRARTAELHPGNVKGRAVLDTWPREELADLSGRVTLRSVQAWLLGYPRPDGGA